jgi:hypothetical protein
MVGGVGSRIFDEHPVARTVTTAAARAMARRRGRVQVEEVIGNEF